jgi:hypothetical protein
MFGTASWHPPTAAQLVSRFGYGEHLEVVADVVAPLACGPHHQPRLRRGTRVRVLDALTRPDAVEPEYAVEVLDPRGRPSGYWAVVPQGNLIDAAELPLVDWLRSLRS